ncbi:MAG: hypothetical protein HGA96_00100 [Desulfobulbaceae bacterium]|nr:hypothetical protein [Desulfobulbaceae bacterium]
MRELNRITLLTRRIKTYCRAATIASSLLLIPALLPAADVISLTASEEARIAKGDKIVRELEVAGKSGRTFEAICLIQADPKDVMQVLQDYEKYPEFMPNVSQVEIVEQRGAVTVLNYILTLPLGIIRKYRLKISPSAPGAPVVSLDWQLQAWPELKSAETITDTSGYWRIVAKGENKSLVLYHVYTDPGPVPFGLGWIVDALSKNSVPDVLVKTKQRTEQRAQSKAQK